MVAVREEDKATAGKEDDATIALPSAASKPGTMLLLAAHHRTYCRPPPRDAVPAAATPTHMSYRTPH